MSTENITRRNDLDTLIEEIIYHNGYDVQFMDLFRDDQLRALSLAITDSRFDSYELICESDLYLERILLTLSAGEFSEAEAGRIIFDRLILAISNMMQELLDDQAAEMRREVSANDLKSYEDEVVMAIFGSAA